MELQSSSSSFPFLFCVLIFTILLVVKMGKRSKSNPYLPPGPRKLPIIGNMHQMIGALPHHKLIDLAQKYGPLMHLQLGEVSVVVVSSPEMAKQVFKVHDVNFAYRLHLLAWEIITYGGTDIAFSPYGEYWRQLRRICTLELLSTRRVKSFRSVREEEILNLVDWISSNTRSPINLSEKIFALGYAIASRTALMKNKKILNKAQSEVRQKFNKTGRVDEDGVLQLQYLQQVINETLRLHPPGPLLIPRECRSQCEVGGFEIPAKTRLIVNAWAIGRDPKYWKDPEKFYPERFLDSTIDFKGNHFELVPLSAGRRMCPGMLFSITSLKFQLANLLYHFDWKLPNGGMNNEELDLTEEFGLTVTLKNDLYLVPTPYQPPSSF